MSTQESLLDTFPGRIFIKNLKFFRPPGGPSPTAFIAGMRPEKLIREATHAIGLYLYSNKCLEVLHIDVNEPELREFDTAGLAALSKLSTFGSPQIHQGTLKGLHNPTIHNRHPLSALPDGAFWTSTPIGDNEDSWTMSGENVKRESPRWTIHFDPTQVRVARIDSSQDWVRLIDSNASVAGDCKYPDWPAIAQHWAAVHLSPTGLLLAHPTISSTSFTSRDGSGYAHSNAGRYPSVAGWSAVSTAWLHKPPDAWYSAAHDSG
jgi:hypothetical protein